MGALLRAAHIEPTIAVTVLAALLARASGLGAARLILVTAAVFAGRLVIGWSNNLLDAGRDAAVRRHDKPLATGGLTHMEGPANRGRQSGRYLAAASSASG